MSERVCTVARLFKRCTDIVVQFWMRFETSFNPLALELDIYSLAHHLCKMSIFYEPRRI